MTDEPRHRVPRLATALRVALWTSAALSVVALLAPGDIGGIAADALVGVLIGTPLARVAYLALRWVRRGDLRAAAIGALLLAITGVGVLLGG
jgi:hypothetical protein